MKEENPDNLRLTPLQKDILILLKGQTLHGLQLMDQLNIDRPNKLSFGGIHPSINVLVRKGCVDGVYGEDEDREELSGARRKYYGITGKGKRVLVCALTSDASKDFGLGSLAILTS
jgi:PadR family transcriptional regulator, regulatory protein PadR